MCQEAKGKRNSQREKNQSIEMNPIVVEKMELANKDIKMAI